MNCEKGAALSALRRGHVTWQTLHPSVKKRLYRGGYTPDHPSFRGTPAAAPRIQANDYDHVFDEDHG